VWPAIPARHRAHHSLCLQTRARRRLWRAHRAVGQGPDAGTSDDHGPGHRVGRRDRAPRAGRRSGKSRPFGSIAFTIYVSKVSSYDKTYGSLRAVIILLLWFYLTAYVILAGAELDAEIKRQPMRAKRDPAC
jgi:hypothetical protein